MKRIKHAVLLLGLLLAIPMFAVTAGAAEAANILENHDVFYYYPKDEQYIIDKISTILPMQVTVRFTDGSTKMCPVAGAWKNNAAEQCFENTVSGVTGTNTVKIRYKPDQSRPIGILYTTGQLEGFPTKYEISNIGDADRFLVYKTDGSGSSAVKFDSSVSRPAIGNDYATFTVASAALSDSGEYFAVYYKSAGRNWTDDASIFFSPAAYRNFVIDHCWGEYKRFPDALVAKMCCKACGIRRDQVYDPVTGERYPVEKTLEEVLNQDKIEFNERQAQMKQLQQQIDVFARATAADRAGAEKVKRSSVKKKGKNITLKWKKVAGVSYYEVYCRIGKKGKFKKLKKLTGVTYTHRNLKKGQTYYYKVRAVRKTGKEKVNCAFSKIKKKKM